MIYASILQTVGYTPVVRLNHLGPAGSEILVKIEGFNPGRSIKDRAAFFMVEQAERRGLLRPGGSIIESTSGNLGKSLALVGAVKGYRVVLVVDPKTPTSVIRFARALGAEIDVVDTPDAQGGYQRSRIERVKLLAAQTPGSYWPDQYNNPDNPRSHSEQTAQELLADVPRFDVLVTAVSTGGHICGLSRTLKRHLPGLVTVGVDAVGSAAFGFPFEGYRMRGLGLAWHPGNLDDRLVDFAHLVEDYEGIATTRLVARHEGLLVGESSGAAIFAAMHYVRSNPGARCVVVAADDGANYLDETFDEEWLIRSGIAAQIDRHGLRTLEMLCRHARNPSHRPVEVSSICSVPA